MRFRREALSPAVVGPLALLFAGAAALAQPVEVPARFLPPPSWADLADAVAPAVVSIRVATIESTEPEMAPSEDGGDGAGAGATPQKPEKAPPEAAPGGREVDPFEFFFGGKEKEEHPVPPVTEPPAPRAPRATPETAPPPPPGPRSERHDSGGSGFLVSRDGLVVTNYHVVQGATRASVRVADRDYAAEIRGVDPETDLALLQIRAGRDLPYLELGDSDAVRVGDWVMVIGSPLNLDRTVTIGVVSAKGRSIGISDASFENFIQTDAAINFGNSGGPLLDVRGRAVGIATAINFGAENIGFAVPVDTLKGILPQLRDHGRVRRGSIGAGVLDLDAAQAPAFGVPARGGVLIRSVVPGSPAERAGVVHGDVVLAVDGHETHGTHDLIDYVSAKGPGAAVTLDLMRDGRSLQKTLTLVERPDTLDAEPMPPAHEAAWPGLTVESWTAPADADAPRIAGVEVTDVALDGPWYEQGLRPGTVISEVNGRPVASADALRRALADAPRASYVRLYAWQFARGGEPTPFFAVCQVP